MKNLVPSRLQSRGFSKQPERVRLRDIEREPQKLERAVSFEGGVSGQPIEKENALVSEAYRRLVRAMPCMRCGYPPQSQFCHADQGKGIGLKTDDRRGWQGCGPHGTEPGCHWYVGTSGKLPKEVRRAVEHELAAKTRAAILAAGMWPKNLPLWGDE